MKNYLLIATLSVLSLVCAGQNRGINDSLSTLLKAAKQDTNKANILIGLCRNNLDFNDSAVNEYSRQLLKLSQTLHFEKGLIDANNFLGIIADNKADYAKALELYKTALGYARQYKFLKKEAAIYNNMGLIYAKIGDLQKGLDLYFNALRIFEKLNEKKLQGNALSNIGLIYSQLEDNEKGVAFQKKALALRLQEGDEYDIASNYINLSKAYAYLPTEDSSMKYSRMAMALQDKIGDLYGLSLSYQNIGRSYGNRGTFDSAIHYINKSVKIKEDIGDKQGIIFCYRALGSIYRDMKQLDKSLYYLKLGLKLAEEIGSKERIAGISESLGYTYEALGDYKNAYKYLYSYSQYQVALSDSNSIRANSELAVKYEVEKKDLTIAKNQAELKGKQARIENQQLKLTQRNMQLGLLGMLLLAAGLTSYFFYNRYKMKQEARLKNEIIKQQDLASKAIIEAEERERKRIAGDLHDGLGQLCSAIKMNLSSLERQIEFKDKESTLSYEKTLAMTDQACKDVRTISHQMMPNILLKYGLASAVKDFLDKIDARKLQVHLDTFGLQDRLDSNIETVLYRVIQETVNNVIKHSRANKLYIVLNKDEEGISVTIEDNGIGFDVNDKGKFDGIGLKNIASRVGFLKGTVEYDSAPGRGTVVNVWIPSQIAV